MTTDVTHVNMIVTNKFGRTSGKFIAIDITKQPNPDPKVRYYLIGINRFLIGSTGQRRRDYHLFSAFRIPDIV